MKKRIAALLLSTVMAFSLTACGNSAKTEKADNKETKQTTEAVENMSFDEMVDAAKGTTVTFYGWGGDVIFALTVSRDMGYTFIF